jgi:uncharacterized coiled-coil protein SlyX
MGATCCVISNHETNFTITTPFSFRKNITKHFKESKETSELIKTETLHEKDSNSFAITYRLNTREIENFYFEKFINDLINEINFARTNPRAYSKKIKNHMKYLTEKVDSERNDVSYYYKKPNYPKIFMHTGEPAFHNCIKILNEAYPMPPLEFNEDLVIKVPQLVSEMNDKDTLLKLILNKKIELKVLNKYRRFGFHYDNGALDGEVSTILQLVDDNNTNGSRRQNLLNSQLRYMGVSLGKIKSDRFYIYMTFASD